jgi:hypothetical protein
VELSSELIREHAHLIASGVRPLALVGTCEAKPATMLRVTTQLECASGPNAIPFVLDRGDGLADFGYAASSWALDLFKWVTEADSGIPACQKHRIRGLLLGYGVEAIRSFEERTCGRLFEQPSVRCLESEVSRPMSAHPSRQRREAASDCSPVNARRRRS